MGSGAGLGPAAVRGRLLHADLSPAQGSWAPKKEPYAREMLAISFISAVNRKRKKRREARGLGSSTDDDSEQEAHKPEAGAPAPGARDQPEGPLPGAAASEAPGQIGRASCRERVCLYV